MGTVLGGSGLGMSIWNSADIKNLNLKINSFINGIGKAVRTGEGISSLLQNQHAITIDDIHSIALGFSHLNCTILSIINSIKKFMFPCQLPVWPIVIE